ncbi:hypothetical protein DFH09DRAFT_1111816 [Mycena vulgaris]|nr:hypothetical protein DFH09DRAFT_1111816 [Mycena vulgaris]
MDASVIRRFTASNVTWPQDRFFIPHGSLEMFLHDNLRFKVFLVMTAVFPDAYATYTVQTLTKVEHNELRVRIRDIVRHMFFASHIRQNEFRTTYGVIPVPGECAWMFHVILVLLHVIGFAGDDAVVATEEVAAELAEVINDWRWDTDTAEASAGHEETGMTEAVNLALFAKLSTTVGAALDKLEATGVPGDGEAAERSVPQRSQSLLSSSPKEAKIFRSDIKKQREGMRNASKSSGSSSRSGARFMVDTAITSAFRKSRGSSVWKNGYRFDRIDEMDVIECRAARTICGEEGFDAGLFEISEEEGEQIRWLIRLFLGTLRVIGSYRLKVNTALRANPLASFQLSDFAIPPQSCRVFEITLILTACFPPTSAVEDLVDSIIRPVILSMLDVAKSASRHGGGATNYLEYDATGNLAPFQGTFIFPSLMESRAASM